MKKLFLIGLLSIFCLNLFGCESKIDEDLTIPPLTNDVLLDLAAQALPCDEGTSFANFAILGTGVSRKGNLMYYGVDEVVGYELAEDGNGLKDTCYRIAPLAMEIKQSDKGFNLVNVQAVEDYEGNFLIEDYTPIFDDGKLDEAVRAIFSNEAFAVWQQRAYREHFPNYDDINKKTYEERAMEYFGIEASKPEEFISYYDNGAIREKGNYINGKKHGIRITYDEGGNVINIQEYKDGKFIEDKPKSNVLSVKEEDILSTDELKKLCEEQLKEIEPNNPKTTWTEEKLFINTYGFRGYTASDGMHNGSHTYCNITLDGLILTNGFTREATMDELHLSDFGNAGGLGNDYPNLKEYYGFIGNIILGNIYQTTYITGKNTMYFDNSRGIALKLGDEFDEGLIREIDTDEGGLPHSEIIFLVKGDENEENRTGINGYREIFSITAISKENLKNFGASLDDLPSSAFIGENNQYYFIDIKSDLFNNSYSDLIIFDVE